MNRLVERAPQNPSAALRRALFVAGALAVVTLPGARAQTGSDTGTGWRIGAATGAYVPFSSLIETNAQDTRVSAGPAFSLDAQYRAYEIVSVYANGTLAFGTITLGSSIRPAVLGPSNQVTLTGGTAGVLLTPDWLTSQVQPTLRVGGGLKFYSFDIIDTDNQVRATLDVGVGLRGITVGPIDVTAEVRYLPSSFDQSRLPTRGIAPQNQRQNDLFFAIGIGIRG